MSTRTALVLAGLTALAVAAGAPADDRQQVAQFGTMTKIRATPIAQRTAAPGGTRQNVERRKAPSQPGKLFGDVHK